MMEWRGYLGRPSDVLILPADMGEEPYLADDGEDIYRISAYGFEEGCIPWFGNWSLKVIAAYMSYNSRCYQEHLWY
jgi:hypothetical protein